MEIFYWIIFSRFLVLVAACITFYYIGHIAFKYQNQLYINGLYSNIFVKSIVGILLSLLTYSCYKSGFQTINTGLFLIGGFIYYELKKTSPIILGIKEFQLTKHKLNPLLSITIISLICFSIVSYRGYSYNINPFLSEHQDYIYYSNIVKSLIEFGTETQYSTYQYIDPFYSDGTTPYHYIELWFSAIISESTGIYPIEAMQNTYASCFLILFVIGIISICEQTDSTQTSRIIFAFSIMFIGSVFLEEKNYNDFTFNAGLINGPFALFLNKHLFFYPLALLGFLFFITKNEMLGHLTFLTCGLLSSPNFIGITGGTIIYSLFYIKNKNHKRLLIYSFSILIYFYLFNRITNHSFISTLHSNTLELTDAKYFSLFQIKILIAEVSYRIFNNTNWMIQSFAYIEFIVIVSLMYISIQKTSFNRKLLVFVSAVFFTGLIAANIFYKISDALQFLTSNSYLYHTGFITLLIYNYSTLNKLSIGVTIVISLFHFYKITSETIQLKTSMLSNTDSEYLPKITNLELKENTVFGVYFKGKYEYTNGSSKYSLLAQPGHSVLPYSANLITTYNVSNLEITQWNRVEHRKKQEKKLVEITPFYRFVQNQKLNCAYSSIEQSQLDFILAKNIAFIIATKKAILPTFVKDFAKETIINNVNGEKFILLK
jgi:hypothetical protein